MTIVSTESGSRAQQHQKRHSGTLGLIPRCCRESRLRVLRLPSSYPNVSPETYFFARQARHPLKGSVLRSMIRAPATVCRRRALGGSSSAAMNGRKEISG
jgi:hypothetical protein